MRQCRRVTHSQLARAAKHMRCEHGGLWLHQSFLQIPACRKHTLGATGQGNVVRAAQPGSSHGGTASRLFQRGSSEESARLTATPDARAPLIFLPFLHSHIRATADKQLLAVGTAQHCVDINFFNLTSAL